MNKTLGIILVTILAFVFVISGCAQPAPSPAPTATKPAAPAATTAPVTSAPAPSVSPTQTSTQKQFRLAWGAQPAGQAGYAIAIGEANVINKYTAVDVTVESIAATNAQVQAQNKNEIQLSFGATNVYAMAWNGTDDFLKIGKLTNTRVLHNTYPITFAWFTTPSTGIKTMADLKGKKLTTYINQTTAWADALLKAYGIDPEKDVTRVKMADSTAGCDELAAGRVDAVLGATSGAKMLELSQATGGIVLIPVDEAVVEKAKKADPAGVLASYNVATITSKDATYLKAPVAVLATFVASYSNSAVPDEACYQIVKAALQHADEMKKIDPRMAGFGPEIAVVKPPVPFHPGAIKAYKELGLWTPDLEALQQQLMATAK